MITGNIRNLKPGLRNNKIEYIEMMAKNNNAFLISLTESWLSEGVMDAEIYLNGFSAIRSDRCDKRGWCDYLYQR